MVRTCDTVRATPIKRRPGGLPRRAGTPPIDTERFDAQTGPRLRLCRSTPLSLALVTLIVLSLATLSPLPSSAAEPVDLDALNRIRDEGLERSQAMEIAEALTTEIGPRLTGSPQMTRANEWTRDKLTDWGLENAHLESWGPFGRGWSFSRTSVHLVEPLQLPLIALPKAWTPGTDGPVRGEVMRVKIEDEDDLEALRGTLGGKILLLDEPRPLRDRDEPQLERYDADELEELQALEIPDGERGGWRARFRKRWELRKTMNEAFADEGVVATIEISSRDGGLVRVGSGGSRWADESVGVPALVMATEHYNRLARLLDLAGGEVHPTAAETGDDDAEDSDEMDEASGTSDADQADTDQAPAAEEDADSAGPNPPPTTRSRCSRSTSPPASGTTTRWPTTRSPRSPAPTWPTRW